MPFNAPQATVLMSRHRKRSFSARSGLSFSEPVNVGGKTVSERLAWVCELLSFPSALARGYPRNPASNYRRTREMWSGVIWAPRCSVLRADTRTASRTAN